MVVGFLGCVEVLQVKGDEGGGPTKRADCGEAGESREEVRVKRRFGFEVEDADSAGGEEVEFLDYWRGELVCKLYWGVKGKGKGRVAVPQTMKPTTGIVSVKYPAERHIRIAPMPVCMTEKIRSTSANGSSPSTTDISWLNLFSKSAS